MFQLDSSEVVDASDVSAHSKDCRQLVQKLIGRFNNILPRKLFISGDHFASSQELIGSGAFADVYKGTYKGQTVAIKVFRTWANDDTRKAFEVFFTVYRDGLGLRLLIPCGHRQSTERYQYALSSSIQTCSTTLVLASLRGQDFPQDFP